VTVNAPPNPAAVPADLPVNDTGESYRASPSVGVLRVFLAGRDVACPNCEYNLRDLTGDRCPECGQDLVIRVQLAEPKMAAFLAGLIGLSAGAGFSGLILLYWFILTFFVFRGGGGNGARILTLTLGGLALESGAMLGWLRFRGRLRTLKPQTRWTLVVACWILSLVNLVWFSLFIR
jgi:hypothetical protein